jgi:hypothetical protein
MNAPVWICVTAAGALALAAVSRGPSLLAQSGGASPSAPPRNPTRAEVVQMMKEISNWWGRWGKDDETGTFNLIAPAVWKAAICARQRRDLRVAVPLHLRWEDLQRVGNRTYHQATPTREGFGEGPGCMKNSILGSRTG